MAIHETAVLALQSWLDFVNPIVSVSGVFSFQFKDRLHVNVASKKVHSARITNK